MEEKTMYECIKNHEVHMICPWSASASRRHHCPRRLEVIITCIFGRSCVQNNRKI